MVRSFSNRMLGGICGGLGKSTPLNAWLWRLLFIALTIGTVGAGALVYLIWWWILPLASPLYRDTGTGLRGLAAILLSVLLIAGYIVRGNITELLGADVYWTVAFAIVALVYFLKQVFAGTRGTAATGLVLLAIPVIALLQNLDFISSGAFDLLLRAYPAIIIFFGLALLLRWRMPFGGFVALIITVSLTIGVAFYAYSSRVDDQLTDNIINIREQVDPTITTLQLNLSTLDTDVVVSVASDNSREIVARFTGGNNNDVRSTYSEDVGIATLTLEETLLDPLPTLKDIGRSQMTVSIPPEIAVAIAYRGESGEANFDMAAVDLERLNLTQEVGDVLVTLPEYQPQSPSVIENPGRWDVNNGDLRVRVSEDIGARFFLSRSSNPEPSSPENFDNLIFGLELSSNDYVLISRGYETLPVQVVYRVNVPAGAFVVDSIED